jgi:hypothetical protein
MMKEDTVESAHVSVCLDVLPKSPDHGLHGGLGHASGVGDLSDGVVACTANVADGLVASLTQRVQGCAGIGNLARQLAKVVKVCHLRSINGFLAIRSTA